VQKKFENSLSLEEEFALSVKMGRGLAEVPKTVKSSIVEGDKWKQIREFEDSDFGRIARRTIQNSRREKCREIMDREIQRTCGRYIRIQRKNPSEEKSRREYPKKWERKQSYPSIEKGHVERDQRLR
jgi:hypothetical protein